MRIKKSLCKWAAAMLAAGSFVGTFAIAPKMNEAKGASRHLAERYAERIKRERAERTQERQNEDRGRRYVEQAEPKVEGRENREENLNVESEVESYKKQENDLTAKAEVNSREEVNITVREQEQRLTEKILSEAYFDKFKKEPPKFQTSFGEGGDLAGLSSILSCSSTYSMNCIDTGEYVTVSIAKFRSASFYGADTSVTFNAFFKLQTNPIVSKKRQPVFELRLKGDTKTVKFKKISQYGDNNFMVHTGDVHFLDELYVHGLIAATLILSNEQNEVIRIPIPIEVIEQWQKVTSADLKKMKREHEER